nr:hypothetical protein [Haliscomenobacter sp.]
MIDHPAELRIHISLIEVIKEQVGQGNLGSHRWLFDWLCLRYCLRKGYEGFVSLLPKTRLIDLYQKKYGFRQYGRLLALAHEQSKRVIDQYLGDEK